MLDKIKGAYYGAALGSAIGKATQNKAWDMIRQQYGRVTAFLPVPSDAPASGMLPEQPSGEFENGLYLSRHLIASHGVASEEVALAALKEWEQSTDCYYRFVDPTTQYVINGKDSPNRLVKRSLWKGSYFCLSTNGLAVKSYPIGLLSKGDIDQAIKDTYALCFKQYQDIHTLQAGCAVAATVSCAMRKDVSLYDIIRAGLKGAKASKELAREKGCIVYPGPDVEKRMEMAIEIGMQRKDPQQLIGEISDMIGNCCMAAESIPAVFGILTASKGDVMGSIYNAVSLGNASDAAALMCGAVMGAWKGVSSLDHQLLSRLQLPTGFDLEALSAEMLRTAEKRRID
ncbi:MAG: hypothetical protein GX301_09215 [Gracilibacteraceae bacterium]|jgi:ADP-ribosylglycohydrolase|nr:hypothetical protein [Gracilibacteraceae bacterium]